MGGGDTVLTNLPVPKSSRIWVFSFGGADSDDGRLKLTPGAAHQGEAKNDGSIELADLFCGPFLSVDNEDCDELQ